MSAGFVGHRSGTSLGWYRWGAKRKLSLQTVIDPTPLVGVGMVAAFAAGLTGSLHCALMCGPLAAASGARLGADGRVAARIGWHLGRFGAYALVGAGLGLVGGGLAATLARYVQALLPWLMVAGLVAVAFEFGRRLPAGIAGAAVARRLARLGERWTPLGRGALLGSATPFLPCGLLWGIFLVAAGTGGAAAGALVMIAFALGSTPGLATVQLGAAWAGRWPRAERISRIAVPLLAALVVAWRALAAGGDGAHSGHGSHP